jgi:ABC-2 type transport system permease protein
MMGFWSVYGRWLRDRVLSTVSWTVGIVLTVVATAAFYPALSDSGAIASTGDTTAMASLLGLGAGVDPSSPLGFLWVTLYANVFPWMLMALGVALGVAAIASDEDTGALEYLLSKPVTRTTVVLARYAGMITILGVVTILSGLSLLVSLPLFNLDESKTSVLPDGSKITSPGATATDVFNGTFSSFAVALGLAGVAFLLGAALGRKGLAIGIASGLGVGGYVLYTLSNVTGNLKPLTWVSPWRWYIADAMLLHGLTWNVALPFITALVGLVVGWFTFVRRDLRNP